MAVLFAGNEKDAFEFIGFQVGATADATTTDAFDSTAVRSSLNAYDFHASDYIRATLSGGVHEGEIWVHFTHANNTSSSEFDFPILKFFNENGDVIYHLEGQEPNTGNPPKAKINISYFDSGASSTIMAETGEVISADGVRSTIDLRIVPDATNGVVQVWIDGTLVIDFSGATTSNEGTSHPFNFQHLRFSCVDNPSAYGLSSFFSEIIVANEDTQSWRLAQVIPIGSGANSDWTGDFGDVDEIGRTTVSFTTDDTNGEGVDVDFITSSTQGDAQTFEFSDVHTSFSTLEVKAVVQNFRARSASTNAQLTPLIRIGGTDYTGSAFSNLSSSFGVPRSTIWALNPDSVAKWVLDDVASAEFGVSLEGTSAATDVSKMSAAVVMGPEGASGGGGGAGAIIFVIATS